MENKFSTRELGADEEGVLEYIEEGEDQAPAPGDTGALTHWATQRLPLPIMITDRVGRIVYANPALEHTTGYAAAELIGQTPRLLSAGETQPEVYARMWSDILAGKPWEGEIVNRRKNGEIYTEGLNITPLRDAQGVISHFYAVARDLSELRTARRHIEYLSRHDSLTGLFNRVHFLATLAESIHVAERDGREFGLVCLDLDHFRSLNENHGQATGDRVLREMADRLRAEAGKNNPLARLDGDEFALLPWETFTLAGQGELLRRIHDAVEQPVWVDGGEMRLTASFGLAVYPRDGHDPETLLRAADAALAAAKAQEGGGVVCFHPDMLAARLSRQDLAARLRQAVGGGELVLHYQPQLDLTSGRLVGVEALVRWQHPEKGLLPPIHFIDYAEEMGLAWQIDDWVLRAACQQAMSWRVQGHPPLRMAVNLSARHFQSGNLPEVVAAVLAETGMEPGRLELELTETAMMQDAAAAARTIDRLKGIGVRLALDDFGTGYSSLAYLSRFVIDQLKIDRSFVQDVASNPLNASIIEATIAMAHKLGKKVIAEGVETEGQMHFLRRQQCDEMQGYFFSKPLPADELAALLKSGRQLDFKGESASGTARTLLLVDDEPGVLNALRRLFRGEGYRVLTAESAAAALDLLSTEPTQVIISDQRMPGMSGVEFLSRVRLLYPQTVRIVLSGYAEIDTVTEAVNHGAIWKFFSKPWDDDKLIDEIRNAFRLAEAVRP